MMFGIDISNHNYDTIFKTNYGKHLFSTAHFIWMKATEGKSFVDKSVSQFFEAATFNGTPVIGFYHYARPDLNGWQEEAKHFCNTVKEQLSSNSTCTLLALDWEGLSLNYSTEWALNWLKYVEAYTGIKPLVYASESVVNSSEWDSIVENDNGLWVAKWSNEKPNPGAWPFYAFHQYTSTPIDLDIFNGTLSSLKRYGGYLNE